MEPKSLNEWWDKQPDELKQAFTFLPDERWEEADLYLRINIRNYCCLKKDKLLPEDKERSMLIEIVCELTDTELFGQTIRHSMKCAMRTRLFWKNIRTNSTGYTTGWKGAYWII